MIAALGVSALGKSSVTWRVALFEGEYVEPQAASSTAGQPGDSGGAATAGEANLAGWTLRDATGAAGAGRPVRLKVGRDGQPARAAAYGDMVHVFVDPESRRPLPGGMDPSLRAALEKLRVES